MSTVQKAESILSQPDTQLGRLLQRAKQIAELDILVKQYLDKNLAEHCTVCNLKNGRLMIITHSAAFATRLKYEIPSLLERLRQLDGFQKLTGIDCKISLKF